MRSKPENRQSHNGAPVLEINASNFEDEVLKSTEPVLAEFRADWCSRCEALEPILKSMANEKRGAVKFATVDVDRNEPLAGEYYVRGIPTLLLFSKGVIRETIVGSTTELELRQLLECYF